MGKAPVKPFVMGSLGSHFKVGVSVAPVAHQQMNREVCPFLAFYSHTDLGLFKLPGYKPIDWSSVGRVNFLDNWD